MKTPISTQNAPEAIGPYSQAIKANNMLFLSGQIGIDPQNGQIVDGGIEAECHQVFKNIKAVLSAADASLDNVVKATVFLNDMADFQAVNAIYEQYFSAPYPARSAVAVKELPKNVMVEIEIIAMK